MLDYTLKCAVVVFHAVQYAVSFLSVQCFTMLCSATLFCVVLYNNVKECTGLCCAVDTVAYPANQG